MARDMRENLRMAKCKAKGHTISRMAVCTKEHERIINLMEQGSISVTTP